jgi:hypothetical protein
VIIFCSYTPHHNQNAFPKKEGTMAGEISERVDVYRAGEARACIIVAGYPDAGFERIVGCKYKDFPPIVSWARRIAASGVTAITYSNREPIQDLREVIDHVRTLGFDDIALLASSGNAPLAFSCLMRDSGVRISRAALLYPYTLAVPADAKKFGFVTPADERTPADLDPDIPLFIARAGRDEMPRLNETLDGFIGGALAANLPLTLMNHPTAAHAFDVNDNGPLTRAIIDHCLSFLSGSSNSMRLPNGSAT